MCQSLDVRNSVPLPVETWSGSTRVGVDMREGLLVSGARVCGRVSPARPALIPRDQLHVSGAWSGSVGMTRRAFTIESLWQSLRSQPHQH
jgi:hypothetical protein